MKQFQALMKDKKVLLNLSDLFIELFVVMETCRPTGRSNTDDSVALLLVPYL